MRNPTSPRKRGEVKHRAYGTRAEIDSGPCFCKARGLGFGLNREARPRPRGPSLRRVNPMGSMSLWHWIVVIGVVLLLFGRGKISELMGDVAQGIKAFKKGMSDDDSAKTDTPKIEPGKTDPVKTLDHQAADASAAGAKSRAAAFGVEAQCSTLHGENLLSSAWWR